MTEQFHLFDIDKEASPEISQEDGRRKTCPKCSCEYFVSAVTSGTNNNRSYCPSCSSRYWKDLYSLKKEYPVPDNHACECCGKSEDELTTHYSKLGNPISPWRLDHDHETGEFRGWLCNNCNQGLGKFYDDVELLQRAIAYIQKNRP